MRVGVLQISQVKPQSIRHMLNFQGWVCCATSTFSTMPMTPSLIANWYWLGCPESYMHNVVEDEGVLATPNSMCILGWVGFKYCISRGGLKILIMGMKTPKS